MTVANIKSRVVAIIQTAVNDETLNNWITDAYDRIIGLKDWEWLKASAQGTLTTASDYTLSTTFAITDLNKVVKVRDITNNKDYTYVSWDNKDQMVADSAYQYTINPAKDTLTVTPASNGATLQINYLKVPPALTTDANSPIFDSKFHQALVWATIENYYESIEELAEASRYGAKFDNIVHRMNVFYERVTSDEVVRMKSVTEAYRIDF